MINNPETYEILRPEDFGLARYIHVAHRLTGWNAIRDRARQLNIELSDFEIKEITGRIKQLADIQQLKLEDVDRMLRECATAKSSTPDQQQAEV